MERRQQWIPKNRSPSWKDEIVLFSWQKGMDSWDAEAQQEKGRANM